MRRPFAPQRGSSVEVCSPESARSPEGLDPRGVSVGWRPTELLGRGA
jgi:hypothetical protein